MFIPFLITISIYVSKSTCVTKVLHDLVFGKWTEYKHYAINIMLMAWQLYFMPKQTNLVSLTCIDAHNKRGGKI